MDYSKIYSDFLKKKLNLKKSLRVVFDCSNGTTGIILKELFRKSKFQNPKSKKTHQSINSKLINWRPDGRFPAHGPDPWKKRAMDQLSRAVLKEKADLGVIFDADGDRVFFVDDEGRPVSPDIIAALISKNFPGSVILDLRSGYLARELISADRKKIIDSRVGHYFIKQTMRKKKISFGAESSGHYYFKDFYYCDSGIFAAIQFINQVSVMRNKNLKLSEWVSELPKYYRSGELNFEISNKSAAMKRVEEFYNKSVGKISHLDGIKIEGENWWCNVRPSNTENLLRLNLEAKNKKIFDRKLKELTRLLKIDSI